MASYGGKSSIISLFNILQEYFSKLLDIVVVGKIMKIVTDNDISLKHQPKSMDYQTYTNKSENFDKYLYFYVYLYWY